MSRPGPSATLDLCAQSTRAEYAGDVTAARDLARRAWGVADDAVDRCAAAHYLARYEADPSERLRWNKIALEEAGRAAPGLVATWLPSLYLNLGRAHEVLGEDAFAQACYARAHALGLPHQPDGPPELHTKEA